MVVQVNLRVGDTPARADGDLGLISPVGDGGQDNA
jgi:hypothetical protein